MPGFELLRAEHDYVAVRQLALSGHDHLGLRFISVGQDDGRDGGPRPPDRESADSHQLFGEWTEGWQRAGEDRPRYTPTTTFETYPFPQGFTPADTADRKTEYVRGEDVLLPAGLSPARRKAALSVAVAAKALVDLRDEWLNPSALTRKTPEVTPIGLEKSPFPARVTPRAGCEKDLSRRTMTKLYNEMPAWLQQAHETLDNAVANIYGWNDYSASKTTDDAILHRLLAMNRDRATLQSGAQGTLALRTDPALKVLVSEREETRERPAWRASSAGSGRKERRRQG